VSLILKWSGDFQYAEAPWPAFKFYLAEAGAGSLVSPLLHGNHRPLMKLRFGSSQLFSLGTLFLTPIPPQALTLPIVLFSQAGGYFLFFALLTSDAAFSERFLVFSAFYP